MIADENINRSQSFARCRDSIGTAIGRTKIGDDIVVSCSLKFLLAARGAHHGCAPFSQDICCSPADAPAASGYQRNASFDSHAVP